MQEALYYKQLDKMEVECLLCPHDCKPKPGQYGKCRTRVNVGGKLYTESYGILSAISSDPVEKKPFYHFHPGKRILSIGSFGCNLTCDFCQNCEISQINHKIFSQHPFRAPEDIVGKARLHRNNIGLAYTYNEPTVYFEYMIKCAALIKERNLSNVMVTNGYINPTPLQDLFPYMDAFNVDLKSFRNTFYKERSGATLNPVLETIRKVARSGLHLELTFLIIPEYNDGEEEWKEMIRWISDNCGGGTILHVSRYYPHFKLNTPPTPLSTIERFMNIARSQIDFVYPGNTPQLDNHTYCPSCRNLLIERNMYDSAMKGIGPDGSCTKCHNEIAGVFNNTLL
jgi:pyruvate formate lyase activating enzyme